MKYLRKFNESLESPDFITDPEEIREILIERYINSPAPAIRLYGADYDLAIDITNDGVVHSTKPIGYCGSRVGADLQGHLPFRFGVVHEYFDLRKCNVTTLEGSPTMVRGNYLLDGNPITSLKGCPKTITNHLMIENLPITDFRDGPEDVVMVTIKKCNKLTSLEGLPKGVRIINIKEGCINLWDPKGLRDVSCENLVIESGAPIYTLQRIFGDDFNDSLDYNYVRGKIGDKDFNILPSVNLFRFKEALEEFGISSEEFEHRSSVPGIGLQRVVRFSKDGKVLYETWIDKLGFDYVFCDDDGNHVDFYGNLSSR